MTSQLKSRNRMDQNVKPHKLLMTWATDEMKSAGLPSEQDFKVLFQKPLADVWLYCLRHVKSIQTVKHMKGNIAFQKYLKINEGARSKNKEDATFVDEKKQLRQEKLRLSREIVSSMSNIQLLKNEMDQTTSGILETELAYQGVCQRVRDLQRKECLLDSASVQAEETIRRYSEYSKRIELRTQEMVSKSQRSTEEDYITINAQNQNTELETETRREVRLACEAISHVLRDTLSMAQAGKEQDLARNQQELWRIMEGKISSHCVQAIVLASISNTLSAANLLRDETVAVDITKDVDALGFSFRSRTGLQDVSSPPTVENNVRQLLETCNSEHVKRWFKEQRWKNESWKLEARLDSIIAEVHKHVHKALGEHPHNIPLAKSYVNSLISLATERCVAPCLEGQRESYMEKIKKAKQEMEELREKFQTIQRFKELVKQKQSVIGMLAKQNSQAPDHIEVQKKQVLQYISSRSIASHITEVKHLSEGLKDSLISEVDKFLPLLLPCLLNVSLDSTTRVCLLDLSIHSLAGHSLHLVNNICDILHLPNFKSVDRLALHVLDLHHKTQQLRLRQQCREASIRSAQRSVQTTDDINTIIKLYKQVHEHDKAMCEKWLSPLEKRIIATTSHMKQVEAIKSQIGIWWDQPSQFATPWVIAEGMTFDQWRQKWRIAASLLHKKHIEALSHTKRKQ